MNTKENTLLPNNVSTVEFSYVCVKVPVRKENNMTAYKDQNRKKNPWYFTVDLPPVEFDKYGKPKRNRQLRRGFRTKSEAEDAERKLLNEAEKGKIELKGEILLKDIVNFFFDYIENEGKYAKGTIQNYKGYFKKHMEDIKEVPIKKLVPIFIQNWIRNLYKKGASDHVYNSCLKLLKAAFNYAKKLKQVTVNPFDDFKPVSIPKINRDRFEIDELENIIATCKKKMPKFFCIFILATCTGLREGEYSALMPKDIKKLKEGCKIFVEKQITHNELKDRTKTKESTRIVDASEMVYAVLQWHIKKYHIAQNDFLFRAEEGGNIYSKWVERRFKKLLKLCGYPEDYCRVHDLRGEYVDIMHLIGAPIAHTSRQVGHSDTKITNRQYTQILDELPAIYNKKLDDLIFKDFKI